MQAECIQKGKGASQSWVMAWTGGQIERVREGADLAIIAVGQQHGKAVLAAPLGLTRGHKLVKDHLQQSHKILLIRN